MNEEEKQAVEKMQYVLDLINKNGEYTADEKDIKHIIVITNLIIKYQKEIEELEDKNKTLEQLLQGNLYEMYKYYRELANSYQANCISKDKIKEKIEELKNRKIGASTGIFAVQVDILEELLRG